MPSASMPCGSAPAKSRARPVPLRFSRRPGRALLGLAAILVGVVLWFIFTAASVGVRTDPAGASVQVTGRLPAVRFVDRVLARPGDYVIRAQLAGYAPAEL